MSNNLRKPNKKKDGVKTAEELIAEAAETTSQEVKNKTSPEEKKGTLKQVNTSTSSPVRKKRTFQMEVDKLLDLKLLSVNLEREGKKKTQDDLINEFLEAGLSKYRKKGLI